MKRQLPQAAVCCTDARRQTSLVCLPHISGGALQCQSAARSHPCNKNVQGVPQSGWQAQRATQRPPSTASSGALLPLCPRSTTRCALQVERHSDALLRSGYPCIITPNGTERLNVGCDEEAKKCGRWPRSRWHSLDIAQGARPLQPQQRRGRRRRCKRLWQRRCRGVSLLHCFCLQTLFLGTSVLFAAALGDAARLSRTDSTAKSTQPRHACLFTFSAVHCRCQQAVPPRFEFHAGNPLKLDALLVDEASMLDLPVAAALLDALPRTPTFRLVLVGARQISLPLRVSTPECSAGN